MKAAGLSTKPNKIEGIGIATRKAKRAGVEHHDLRKEKDGCWDGERN